MGVEDGKKEGILGSGRMPKEINAVPINGMFGFNSVNDCVEIAWQVHFDIPDRRIVRIRRREDEVFLRRQSRPRIDHDLAASPRAMEQEYERQRAIGFRNEGIEGPCIAGKLEGVLRGHFLGRRGDSCQAREVQGQG
jgi:hypothetical protein